MDPDQAGLFAVAKIRMPMGGHMQAAWYHEYYDETGRAWETEAGISNLAWGTNPYSLLTDRPLIGIAEKAHAIEIEGNVFSGRSREEIFKSYYLVKAKYECPITSLGHFECGSRKNHKLV